MLANATRAETNRKDGANDTSAELLMKHPDTTSTNAVTNTGWPLASAIDVCQRMVPWPHRENIKKMHSVLTKISKFNVSKVTAGVVREFFVF